MNLDESEPVDTHNLSIGGRTRLRQGIARHLTGVDIAICGIICAIIGIVYLSSLFSLNRTITLPARPYPQLPPVEIRLPKISSGELLRILVADGTHVVHGDPLVEIIHFSPGSALRTIHKIASPLDGRVVATANDNVNAGVTESRLRIQENSEKFEIRFRAPPHYQRMVHVGQIIKIIQKKQGSSPFLFTAIVTRTWSASRQIFQKDGKGEIAFAAVPAMAELSPRMRELSTASDGVMDVVISTDNVSVFDAVRQGIFKHYSAP